MDIDKSLRKGKVRGDEGLYNGVTEAKETFTRPQGRKVIRDFP
jgi:hypothetical protein